MSAHIEPPEGGNKKIALLIAVLALLLSLSEIGGKQAENESIAKNIDASNLWSFFQAKTIRGLALAVQTQVALAFVIVRAVRDVVAQHLWVPLCKGFFVLKGDRRPLRIRAGDAGGPQGAHGPRQGDRAGPR